MRPRIAKSSTILPGSYTARGFRHGTNACDNPLVIGHENRVGLQNTSSRKGTETISEVGL
jgi:hypothetical protein